MAMPTIILKHVAVRSAMITSCASLCFICNNSCGSLPINRSSEHAFFFVYFARMMILSISCIPGIESKFIQLSKACVKKINSVRKFIQDLDV